MRGNSGGSNSKVIERTDYLIEDFSEYLTLCDYKDLTLDYTDSKVTDEDVENRIASNLENAVTTVEVTDRAIEEGDIVNLDYVGKYKDTGEPFENGSDQGYDLTIGSGQFIPGFEDALIGHNKGDEFSFDITFPEDYSASELAGVETTFDIVVNKISTQVSPELNDEFVVSLDIDDVKTVEEYRAYINDQLLDEAEENIKSSKIAAIWNVIMEDSEVIKYPEKELEDAVTKTQTSLEQNLSYYGMTVDDYIEQYCDGSQDTYNEQLKEQAKSNVKSYLIVYALADELEVVLTEDDFNEGLEKYYADYEDYYKSNNMDPEYTTIDEFREYAEENDFAFYLIYEKLSDMLLDLNKFVVKDATSIEEYISSAQESQDAANAESEAAEADTEEAEPAEIDTAEESETEAKKD